MTHEKIARRLTFDRDRQRAIVAALRQVELDALERAAKKIESIAWSAPTATGEWALREAARVIVAEIRSLKEQTQAEDSEGVR